MRGSTSMVVGAGCGLVGLVLMIVETVRVLTGSTLGTVNTVLLFVGLALLAFGGVLLVVAVMSGEEAAVEAEPALADEPAQTAAAEESASEG